MPDVLVDPQGPHPIEPGRVGVDRRQQRSDPAPGGAELAGQASDRGVLTAQLADRPPARSNRQQRPRRDDLVVPALLGERARQAQPLRSGPGPLEPHHPHRPPEARSIDQGRVAAAVADHDHPTLIGEEPPSPTGPTPPSPSTGRGRAPPAARAARPTRRAGHSSRSSSWQGRAQHSAPQASSPSRSSGNGSWSFGILRASALTSPHHRTRRVHPGPPQVPRATNLPARQGIPLLQHAHTPKLTGGSRLSNRREVPSGLSFQHRCRSPQKCVWTKVRTSTLGSRPWVLGSHALPPTRRAKPLHNRTPSIWNPREAQTR